jgi:uncharacterized protein with FMN-binding domain
MNNSSIKKYAIAGAFVVAFVAYLIFANKNSAPATTPIPPVTDNATTKTPSIATPSTTASGTPTTGKYKDGTYTGSVADAFYGNLQAVVVIKGGAIVDVQIPQYPQNGHSVEVNSAALPVLKQEAIASQNAQMNIVSGATQSSEAFQQSLAIALAAAKN